MGLSCHASSLYSPRDAFGAHYDFRWDDNGNLVNSHAHAPHTDRRLAWTEDEAAQSERRASLLAFPSQSSVGVANRLQAFMERGEEGGTAAYYNYSADGERNIKLTSPRMLMSQNASMYSNPQLIYPTLYASPLITLTQRGYTKHYFEEDCRVCSRLGGGFRGQIPDEEIDTKVEVLNASYENLFKQQQTGIHNTFRNCIGAKPIIYEMYDLRQMLREYVGDEKSYFYHSDHLGSAAYLTSGGDVTQTLNYLPYGEDWIDVQFNLDPRLGQYTFNGKEKDYESGFHYYGARYYWSEVLTGWLSVDPMMDKYPNISPYNYCMWNPIGIIDPDGQDGWEIIAGYCIGFVTNMVPGSGRLRDAYAPSNPTDYNNALRAADNASVAVGYTMTATGAAGTAAGAAMVTSGSAVSLSLVGAPEGVATAATGVAVMKASAAVVGAGTAIAAQATANASQGYNRGGQKAEPAKLTNKEVASEAKRMGMKPTKYRTHWETVYKKGNNYYSYDNTSHKGGMWKVFKLKNNKLQRIGTVDKNLKIIGE